MNYTVPFNFDGKKFETSEALARYLANNFRKGLEVIKSGSLFNFLQTEDETLYQYLVTNVSDFEYIENILTLTIYMLDNNQGIVAKKNRFNSNYDIAGLMKTEYPNINRDAFTLFKDKVLALIFWNEYEKRGDTRYKRNYTFMLHIYENRMYDFTYFYYLFLHLENNEKIRFMIDGVKMQNVADIPSYLIANYERASVIIDEILQNAFILALIAIASGIDMVSQALQSDNKYAILKPIAKLSNVDLTLILRRRMAFWLLNNYLNYQYDTTEAETLLNDYNTFMNTEKLNSVADYLALTDEVNTLYQRFLKLFNYNRIVKFKEGITASADFYLAYRYNDEYVCRKYLKDFDLFDETLHTDIYEREVEREVLVEVLEAEKVAVCKFQTDAMFLASDLKFNHKEDKAKGFISSMMMILGIVSLLLAYLVGFYGGGESINLLWSGAFESYVNYGLLALLGVSVVLNIIATAKYHRLNVAYELLDDIRKGVETSINAIDEEERKIVNPPKKVRYKVITHLDTYEANRQTDLASLRKVSEQKTQVNRALIVLGNILFTLPFMVIVLGLLSILNDGHLFNYSLNLGSFDISVVLVGYFILNTLLVIFLRKKNFIYYLFVLLLVITLGLTFIF